MTALSMAGPRNKRKRTEAPTDVAPDKGRGAIGTEPAPKVSRTDNAATPVERLGPTPVEEQPTDAKDNAFEPQNGLTIDGNDHAESEARKMSLIDQNLLEQAIDATLDATNTEPLTHSSVEPLADTPEVVLETKKISVNDLLEHRKKLLDRLRQAKSAAQKRIDIIHEKEPSRQQETDEQEIAAYNETARVATAIARKQARAEVAVPSEQKRSALRKGSTVGKKMNAALSTLVSGSAAADLSPRSSNSPTDNVLNSTARQFPTQTSTVVPPESVVGSIEAWDKVPAKKDKYLAQVMLNRNTGISMNSKHSLRPTSAAPTSSVSRSIVLCPETMTLRERKKFLESRLSSLYLERYQRTQHEQKKEQSLLDLSLLSSVSTPSRKGDSPSKVAIVAAISGPGDPTRMPCRRNTHWDNLLEEMKWLATDFIEERKWKRTAVKVLGESFRVSQSELGKKKTGERAKNHTHSKGQPNVSSLRPSLSSSKPANHDDDTCRSRCRASHMYCDICEADKITSREVARMLSEMVSRVTAVNLNDVGLEHNYCSTTGDEASRFERLESSEPNGTQNVFATESPPPASASLSLVDKYATFQGFSAHVDRAVSSFGKGRGGQSNLVQPKGLPVDMSTDQLRAIDVISGHWEKSRCGIQLGGPTSSGKTMLVCALLAKQCASGPQLVLCCSSSVVSAVKSLCSCTFDPADASLLSRR